MILTESERQALRAMAEDDLRFPREQLRYLLRLEAQRRGLLPVEDMAEFIEVSHATD